MSVNNTTSSNAEPVMVIFADGKYAKSIDHSLFDKKHTVLVQYMLQLCSIISIWDFPRSVLSMFNRASLWCNQSPRKNATADAIIRSYDTRYGAFSSSSHSHQHNIFRYLPFKIP